MRAYEIEALIGQLERARKHAVCAGLTEAVKGIDGALDVARESREGAEGDRVVADATQHKEEGEAVDATQHKGDGGLSEGGAR